MMGEEEGVEVEVMEAVLLMVKDFEVLAVRPTSYLDISQGFLQ